MVSVGKKDSRLIKDGTQIATKNMISFRPKGNRYLQGFFAQLLIHASVTMGLFSDAYFSL
jgi:hypothetical protein